MYYRQFIEWKFVMRHPLEPVAVFDTTEGKIMLSRIGIENRIKKGRDFTKNGARIELSSSDISVLKQAINK